MSLKRSISMPGLLLAAIGGVIGSGWLFGPFFAAKIAGPAAIISWLIGGVMIIIVALTFAELSSTFPVAGGTVRFLHLSHGTLVNFTMAWIIWLASAAVAPIETTAMLDYISTFAPWITHKVGDATLLTLPGILLAAFVMLIICIINALGAKFLSKTNSLVVIVKLLIPIITIITLLAVSYHSSNLVAHGFAPNGLKGILIALPNAGVIFSLIGFSTAIQLAGEAKNPQRSIPFAIIGALCICIIFYVVLQLSFLGALSHHDITKCWAHLTFKGDAGPFAGITLALGLLWLVNIIYIGSLISPFGTALIYTAATARTAYAMGGNGYLPRFLMHLNRFGVPVRLIALNFVIGMFLFLPFPTWQAMVSFLVSALVLAYAVGPLALVVLRKNMPNQPRPFRLPAPTIISLIAFYVCNLIVFWTGWHTIYKILITIVLGYVVLTVYKLTSHGKQLQLHWHKSWWLFLYIAAMGLVSFYGSFGGGKNIVPFGWDFLVIAVLSVIIFGLAYIQGTRVS